jgi:hypothetical protein
VQPEAKILIGRLVTLTMWVGTGIEFTPSPMKPVKLEAANLDTVLIRARKLDRRLGVVSHYVFICMFSSQRFSIDVTRNTTNGANG